MISRRSLLKILIPAAGVGLARLTIAEQFLPSGQAADPGRVVTTHWTDDAARESLALQSAESPRSYTSEIYRSTHPFNGIGSFWLGTVTEIWVRASADGSDWIEWHRVTTDMSEDGPPDRLGRIFGDLISLSPSRYVQYRYTIPAGEPPITVMLVLMDSTSGPSIVGPVTPDPDQLGIAAATPQTVISRAQWGCDESLRFDSQGREIWAREYRVLQKTIVHHTDTKNDYSDAAAEVRLVYHYHAVTQGWGDVGYNFLIDKWGNIYEGRSGGERVVGGHVRGYNRGSLGIACLGSFGGGRYTGGELAAPLRQSLARLIAWKCQFIDPHGQTHFVSGHLPNIMGHRDAAPSICPGTTLYAHLPGLRGDVLWNLDGIRPQPAGQIRNVAFIPANVPAGSNLRVEITIENTGTGTLVTQGPAPDYAYQEGRTFHAEAYNEIASAWRVAVDYEGNNSGLDYPYRWGLPDALEPGSSTRIVGYIRLNNVRTQRYWAGLVQEAVGWAQTGAGTATIVVSPNASPTPAPSPNSGSDCIPRPPPVEVTPYPNNPALQRKIYIPRASLERNYCD